MRSCPAQLLRILKSFFSDKVAAISIAVCTGCPQGAFPFLMEPFFNNLLRMTYSLRAI